MESRNALMRYKYTTNLAGNPERTRNKTRNVSKNNKTNKEAKKNMIQGSPTIKEIWKDIFPKNHKNYSMDCRLNRARQSSHDPQQKRWSRKRWKISTCHECVNLYKGRKLLC